MQIGIRLHDTEEAEFEERLMNAKRDGFSCVHFALAKTRGLPKERENLTPGYAMYLRNAFRKADIDPAVLGCYLNLGDTDQESLKETKLIYRAHIRLASILGCGMVGTETGALNHEYSYDKDKNRSQEALDYFIENLRDVVDDAEKFGVILAIEPVYKHIVYSPERAAEVLKRIGSPNLQIIFDPVNLIDPEDESGRDDIIERTIDMLGENIAMIHLKDYRITDGKMDCMACGFGDMDYKTVLKFAKERKPYIQATLENTKPENARLAAEHIRKIYDRI